MINQVVSELKGARRLEPDGFKAIADFRKLEVTAKLILTTLQSLPNEIQVLKDRKVQKVSTGMFY